MFINFARTLFEILVKDEFSYIKRQDNRLIYETEALSLYLDKGSVLYIVTIFDAEKLEPEKYDAFVSRYSSILDGDNRARVVLMNVFVNDNDNKFASTEDYVPEKKCYIFSYFVDLERSRLTVPAEQPDLLNMESRVAEAVAERGEEYVIGTHLEHLEQELSERYALPKRSNDIYLTLFLIILNIAVWLLMEFSGGSSDTWTLVAFGALSENLVINLGQYYRFFTAIFLHIGAMHLASNCLGLYIYGSRIEKYFGKLKLMIIFIVSGIVGNIVTIFFYMGVSAGASGAIFGLLGALLAVTYRTGRSVDNLSPYLVLLLCVSSIGMGFINPAVNNFAHVAGFLTGVIIGRFSYSSRAE